MRYNLYFNFFDSGCNNQALSSEGHYQNVLGGVASPSLTEPDVWLPLEHVVSNTSNYFLHFNILGKIDEALSYVQKDNECIHQCIFAPFFETKFKVDRCSEHASWTFENWLESSWQKLRVYLHRLRAKRSRKNARIACFSISWMLRRPSEIV
jgi:hypothetical protein